MLRGFPAGEPQERQADVQGCWLVLGFTPLTIYSHSSLVYKMAEVEVPLAGSSDREIKLLETVEDIQNRREQVLQRYSGFKAATLARRKRLEDAKRYFQFKRDADEVEAWINERLQTAADESFRDPTNLQVFCYFDL